MMASIRGTRPAYSRQNFALADAGYMPRYFAEVHPEFKTPHRAIVAGGLLDRRRSACSPWCITISCSPRFFRGLLVLAFGCFGLTRHRRATAIDRHLAVTTT
jgi:hypothetical protein